MGAEGLRPEHPFTRHIAAAQIAGFTDGATNILKDRVARLTARKET
jgi:alkylation response protein AidB-like acyl-CoA dehydrogenase